MNIFTGRELRQQLGMVMLSVGLAGLLIACNQPRTEEAAATVAACAITAWAANVFFVDMAGVL